MKIVESDEGKGIRKIPPKDMNGGARVLRGVNDMHYWGVERKGWGDMDLNNDQGVVMDLRTPLKIMKCANKERRSCETCV